MDVLAEAAFVLGAENGIGTGAVNTETARVVTGVPIEERHKVLYQNALRVYGVKAAVRSALPSDLYGPEPDLTAQS